MAEVANYIYGFAAVCGAALAAFGGIIMTLSPQHTRLARGFVIFSAIPVFLMPITFGCSASSPIIGLTVAGVSAFVVGMIYYIGIAILDAHIKHTDWDSQHRVS
jgi:hypothetical protein